MSDHREGEEIRATFGIAQRLMLTDKGQHPNFEVVVEEWGKKYPKIRRFDLRFWGEEGEPGYAIRFEQEQVRQIIILLQRALEGSPGRLSRKPWWKFWA